MHIKAIEADGLVYTVLRRHILFMTIVAVYAAIVWSFPAPYSRKVFDTSLSAVASNFAIIIPQVICIVLVWRVFYATYVIKPIDRMAWLREDILSTFRDRERMASGLIATVTASIGLATYARGKTLIPHLNEFSWDEAFTALDQTLHFGAQPFEVLHGLFTNSFVVNLVGYNYGFWFALLYFVLYICCFSRPDAPARMQYLIAFVLTWGIGGNLLATLFSSAGPVYFARLGLGDTFEPLMQILHSKTGPALISVFELQENLWSLHTRPESFSVISAFPSMHVASSTLMAIVAFKFRRWAGILMSIFAGFIMLGSVLLGWHYAVDGYAGALVAVICWKLAGWLIRSPIGPFTGHPN